MNGAALSGAGTEAAARQSKDGKGGAGREDEAGVLEKHASDRLGTRIKHNAECTTPELVISIPTPTPLTAGEPGDPAPENDCGRGPCAGMTLNGMGWERV
jgi:hypothetical protein